MYGGMNLKLTSFGKPNARRSLVYTLEVTSCVGNTKASSEYIVFKGASIHKKKICKFQHQEIPYFSIDNAHVIYTIKGLNS